MLGFLAGLVATIVYALSRVGSVMCQPAALTLLDVTIVLYCMLKKLLMILLGLLFLPG